MYYVHLQIQLFLNKCQFHMCYLILVDLSCLKVRACAPVKEDKELLVFVQSPHQLLLVLGRPNQSHSGQIPPTNNVWVGI